MAGRRRVKCTKERCMKCKYSMNLTGASMVKKGDSGALIACGYCLKTGECRTVKDGKKREDYKPGYCNFYEEGERVRSFDDPLNNKTNAGTIKKRRIANA